MKKLLFLFALFVLLSCVCYPQNLVPNPSFEDYDICPDNYDQIYRAVGWTSWSGTPEYFNCCATPGTYSVPDNYFGFQLVEEGCAYAGLYAYVWYAANSREFIGRSLSLPLTIGVKYYLSFKVSLSNENNCGTNKIGALLSSTLHNNLQPNNFAHVYCDNIVNDTLNWTIISGSFIADSNYQYIAIGNFFKDTLTQYSTIDNSIFCMSYYYIDDVCISADSLTCDLLVAIDNNNFNHIKIYPIPANRHINIDWDNSIDNTIEIFVYDIFGKLLTEIGNIQKPYTIDLSGYPVGIYFLQIKSNNNITVRKIIIN